MGAWFAILLKTTAVDFLIQRVWSSKKFIKSGILSSREEYEFSSDLKTAARESIAQYLSFHPLSVASSFPMAN